VFPGPLREFVESEWPPVEGECLGRFACRGEGYGTDCVPRPGEFCGQAHYELLARECPGEPWRLAAARRADARERWRSARLSWLGEDHPRYVDEFVAWLAG
jgi:hypothetical protein